MPHETMLTMFCMDLSLTKKLISDETLITDTVIVTKNVYTYQAAPPHSLDNIFGVILFVFVSWYKLIFVWFLSLLKSHYKF